MITKGYDMLQITIKADYAVRVAIYLAQQGVGARVSAMDIARDQQVPKALIPKILQAMARKGIITTSSGRNGGAVLSKDPTELSIYELIEAIDGPITLSRCLKDEGICPRDSFCPVHPFWAKTREKFIGMLEDAKISDIIRDYYGDADQKSAAE